MRIFNSIANNDKRALAKRLCVGEYLIDGGILGLGCYRYYSLVLCTAGEDVKLLLCNLLLSYVEFGMGFSVGWTPFPSGMWTRAAIMPRRLPGRWLG